MWYAVRGPKVEKSPLSHPVTRECVWERPPECTREVLDARDGCLVLDRTELEHRR